MSRSRASYTSDDLFGFAESYSRLVTNLRFVGPEQKTQLLLVTSALPGDGKTTVATNLALTMAREGKRVLLIDSDLRNGRVDGTLGLPVGPGLAEVLKNQIDVGYAIATVAVNGTSQLHVLARGAGKVDPAPLLASDAPRALLGYLRSRYDNIVIDTPPVNSVADAALLTRYCDGVLFVARAGVTTHDALVFAVEQLRIVHAPVIGAVLNDVDLRGDAAIDGAYQYYGQYHPSRSSA
jgi:capsular exopolysaccharide synthesis family protein